MLIALELLLRNCIGLNYEHSSNWEFDFYSKEIASAFVFLFVV